MRASSEEYGEKLRKQKEEYEKERERKERRKGIIPALLIPLAIIGIIGLIYYITRPTPQRVSPIPGEPAREYSYTATPLINEEYFEAVRKAFGQAEKSIKVLMMIIKPGDRLEHPVNILLQDLVRAHQRGVEVTVIVEGSRRREGVYFLRNAGIEAKFDTPYARTHDKLIIIDDNIAIVGAHNWSYMALTKNNEVSFLIKSEPPDPPDGFFDSSTRRDASTMLSSKVSAQTHFQLGYNFYLKQNVPWGSYVVG